MTTIFFFKWSLVSSKKSNTKQKKTIVFLQTINNPIEHPFDAYLISPSRRWEETWEEPEYERPWKPQEFHNKKKITKIFRFTRVHKRGIDLNLSISEVDCEEFYLMFLSREIDIKLSQNYTKTYICKIWYKILSFK